MMTWEDRTDRASILGIMFVLGWICSQGYYQVPKLWHARDTLGYVQTRQVPALKAKLKVLHNCVRVAVPAAKQAIAAAQSDTVDVPAPTTLNPCRNVPSTP